MCLFRKCQLQGLPCHFGTGLPFKSYKCFSISNVSKQIVNLYFISRQASVKQQMVLYRQTLFILWKQLTAKNVSFKRGNLACSIHKWAWSKKHYAQNFNLAGTISARKCNSLRRGTNPLINESVWFNWFRWTFSLLKKCPAVWCFFPCPTFTKLGE